MNMVTECWSTSKTSSVRRDLKVRRSTLSCELPACNGLLYLSGEYYSSYVPFQCRHLSSNIIVCEFLLPQRKLH